MDNIFLITNDVEQELFSIADLAKEFDISTRTIRFYESKGLITPKRVGTTRIFQKKDRARLILILRGKRLGFSLKDIAEYLDLYHADDKQVTQVKLLYERVNERLEALRDQKHDLETAIQELEFMQNWAKENLERQAQT